MTTADVTTAIAKRVLVADGAGYVESLSQPGKYFRNNVANTITLLEAVPSVGIGKIVFSSTGAMSGMPVELPMRDENAGTGV